MRACIVSVMLGTRKGESVAFSLPETLRNASAIAYATSTRQILSKSGMQTKKIIDHSPPPINARLRVLNPLAGVACRCDATADSRRNIQVLTLPQPLEGQSSMKEQTNRFTCLLKLLAERPTSSKRAALLRGALRWKKRTLNRLIERFRPCTRDWCHRRVHSKSYLTKKRLVHCRIVVCMSRSHYLKFAPIFVTSISD